ncbi:hypothetical protein NSQ61_08630 [Aeribacillus sp. FSL K6-1121]|uniref:hypothetical protein n=1 Tax=Aeribacillus sp. FSL K6-1121 TaxID=2954745 RepID=UPI0030FA61E8
MKEALLFIVELINDFHDNIIHLVEMAGFQLTDKQLHFWIIGIFGMVIFFITHVVFKYIAKFGILCISFIYTMTVLVVIVFAIEIQQKITNRGNMEFEDIVQGLWGFLALFFAFLSIYIVYKGAVKIMEKTRSQKVRKGKSGSRMSRYHSS